MISLDDIAECEFRACSEVLLHQAADDVMTPHLTGYTEAGPRFTIAAAWENDRHKAAAAEFCRKKLREHDCVAYSMSSEAWVATYTRGRDELDRLPSDRPDRIEALIVYAEARGKILTRCWEIVRREDGRIGQLKARGSDGFPSSLMFGGLLDAAVRQ